MEIAEFVELKRPRWAALERLLDKAETGGLKTLNLDEARALSRLYRGTSSDLLWVRARAGSHMITFTVSDFQEAKNQEDVAKIKPNTATFTRAVVVG